MGFVQNFLKLGRSMSNFLSVNKILVAGVAARVVLLVIFVPHIVYVWFAPFVEHFLSNPSFDPWQAYLNDSGAQEAFPYGVLTLILFAVPTFLLSFLGEGVALWVIPLVMLVVELCVIFAILSLLPKSKQKIAALLWAFNPIILFATYIHGQIDILSAAFIFFSCFFLWKNRFGYGGLFLGIAVSIKLSALIPLPIIIFFILRNDRYRGFIFTFLSTFLAGASLTFLFLGLEGYRAMVLGSPQFFAILQYQFSFSTLFPILVAPAATALLAFAFWKFKRSNTQILVAFIALTLLIIPLFSPASPGWFIWSVPLFLLIVQFLPSRVIALTGVFWFSAAVMHNFIFSGAFFRFSGSKPVDFSDLPFQSGLSEIEHSAMLPLLSTAFIILGVALCYFFYIQSVATFDLYNLQRCPLSMAIAGDSGTGKDTICKFFADVFGGTQVSFLMGDDYHLHDRYAKKWNVYTHLDPQANDLDCLAKDFMNLLSGREVWSKHYDHDRGRFTTARVVNRGEVVVTSGLHSLTSLEILQHVDLKVFLLMDHDLRVNLKVKRDMQERGYDLEDIKRSFRVRKADAQKYIAPQFDRADLVITLKSEIPLADPYALTRQDTPLSLVFYLRGLSAWNQIVKLLRSSVGIPLFVSYTERLGEIIVEIPNTEWVGAADIRDIAAVVIERNEEISIKDMGWVGGNMGLMQLFLVVSLLEKRKLSRSI